MNTSSKIHFKVRIQNPSLNYLDISLIYFQKTKTKKYHLPNWTPGSYFIRNYSTHLHLIHALNQKKQKLNLTQKSLTSWEISSNKIQIHLNYKIYSFENSVRTNFLDTEFAFINPASSFLYPEDELDSEISIEFELNDHFKYIYSSLKKKKNILYADNFDELFDSPIQLSNKKSYFFNTKTTEHEILIEGELRDSIREKLIKDLKLITEFENDLMKISPNQKYLFILHLIPNSYGGLEHSKSSVNSFDPTLLHDNFEYKKLLGLLAHEYFHLWNIKRIRPIALGPFDYQNPNYTNELWIAEGITSFYDNYILLQTNIYSNLDYLEEINSDYARLENNSGELFMSLENSSFTAWNKFYLPNSNSINTGISYYTKGSILVFCMYIYILYQSNGKISFTEILIYLYNEFYIKKKRGFTKQEFFNAAKKLTGLDLLVEFDKYLIDKIRIPINSYLNLIGLERIDTSSKKDFGFDIEERKGKFYISKIYKHLPIKDSDINLNDELISINQFRYSKDKEEFIKSEMENNSEVDIILSRRGKILFTKLKTTIHTNFRIILSTDVTENTKKLRDTFFGKET